MTTCGFADIKATARYGMGIGDTIKLQTYYKDCWNEFEDKSPSEYFIYIAGGFDKSVDTVCRNLSNHQHIVLQGSHGAGQIQDHGKNDQWGDREQYQFADCLLQAFPDRRLPGCLCLCAFL